MRDKEKSVREETQLNLNQQKHQMETIKNIPAMMELLPTMLKLFKDLPDAEAIKKFIEDINKKAEGYKDLKKK